MLARSVLSYKSRELVINKTFLMKLPSFILSSTPSILTPLQTSAANSFTSAIACFEFQFSNKS
jgi:hypothetical protein